MREGVELWAVMLGVLLLLVMGYGLLVALLVLVFGGLGDGHGVA